MKVMKYLFLIPVILLFVFSSCTQLDKSKQIKELTHKVDSLNLKVNELSEQNRMIEEEFTWIENELMELRKGKNSDMGMPLASPSPSAKAAEKSEGTEKSKISEKTIASEKVSADVQCLAITNSGKRCSRLALKGSKYCLQHKQTYEPDLPGK